MQPERPERFERRALMAGHVKSGMDAGEVAKLFGVCLQTVRTSCREHGVELPRRVRRVRPAGSFAILAKLLQGERTPKEIALDLGIHVDCVYRVAKDARSAGILPAKAELEPSPEATP